jgi:hypothetical protein
MKMISVSCGSGKFHLNLSHSLHSITSSARADERRWHINALGGLQVDDQFEGGRRITGSPAGPAPLEID